MRKQADELKVCPIPDACLLVMAQRPARLLGLPETRSLIFVIKNSPDQAEGYLDYLQPVMVNQNHLGNTTLPLALLAFIAASSCCPYCSSGTYSPEFV